MRTVSSRLVAGSLIALATAALTMGCSDPLRPEDVAGIYVLRTIDGDTLPAADGPGDVAPDMLVADTLLLQPNGKGSIVTVWSHEPNTDDDSPIIRFESELTFETTDGRIEITLVCPPDALMICVGGPHIVAQRIPGGLLGKRVFGEPVRTLFYVRLPSPGAHVALD